MSEQEMREEILSLVRAYCERYHAPKEGFSPGDRLPYAARVYDHEEMENLVASALEFWPTARPPRSGDVSAIKASRFADEPELTSEQCFTPR